MYIKYTLDNGLRIVAERIPHVRSVSAGIWVRSGSRNETKNINGISHFIEHMMFKGTDTRTAKDIARCIDDIGGQINAFTGKECTCFYTKTLDEHLDIGIDVLSDMFFNSQFIAKDMKTEKKVILEEIGMYEDTPEELVHDVLSEAAWQENPLGFPILGKQDSLELFNKSAVKSYMKNNYQPQNCVISIAGNFSEKELVENINRCFSAWKPSTVKEPSYSDAQFTPGVSIKRKETEQIHLCIAFNGIETGNDKLYTLLALNNVIGGGMSSNLFQRIREEKGLVYSVYSYPSSYKNAGIFTIYACMNPENIKEVISLICEEISKLTGKRMTAEDTERSKEQLKGGYILGLESTGSRMNSIGKSELLLGYTRTPDEILECINSVTADDTYEIAGKIFDKNHVCISAVGNISPDTDLISMLKI